MRQTLSIPGDKPASLSASTKQNPTVAIFRYRGVQVAETGWEPVTAGLWNRRVLTAFGHIDLVHKTTPPLGHCRHIGRARTSFSDRVLGGPNLNGIATAMNEDQLAN